MKTIYIYKLKTKKVMIRPLLMQLYAFNVCGKIKKEEEPIFRNLMSNSETIKIKKSKRLRLSRKFKRNGKNSFKLARMVNQKASSNSRVWLKLFMHRKEVQLELSFLTIKRNASCARKTWLLDIVSIVRIKTKNSFASIASRNTTPRELERSMKGKGSFIKVIHLRLTNHLQVTPKLMLIIEHIILLCLLFNRKLCLRWIKSSLLMLK